MSGKPPDPAQPRPAAAHTETAPTVSEPAAAAREPQAAHAVLMIRPKHFAANAETAASNRFQSGEIEPDARVRARAQFDTLVDALRRRGVVVHVLEGRDSPVCPDEVFPNNWLSTHADGTLVQYPLLAPNRRRERRADIAAALQDFGYTVARIVDLSGLEEHGEFVEGTGSLVLDRPARIAYACLSARTSRAAVQHFCARMGYEPIVFSAADRHGHSIYHTNVMMSVGSEFAMVCSASVGDRRERRHLLDALRAGGKRVIEIGFPQLHAFAGNLLEVRGDRDAVIALSQRALDSLEPRQRAALSEHGVLAVAPIDTIETLGGGSVRCMLAEVHLERA